MKSRGERGAWQRPEESRGGESRPVCSKLGMPRPFLSAHPSRLRLKTTSSKKPSLDTTSPKRSPFLTPTFSNYTLPEPLTRTLCHHFTVLPCFLTSGNGFLLVLGNYLLFTVSVISPPSTNSALPLTLMSFLLPRNIRVSDIWWVVGWGWEECLGFPAPQVIFLVLSLL